MTARLTGRYHWPICIMQVNLKQMARVCHTYCWRVAHPIMVCLSPAWYRQDRTVREPVFNRVCAGDLGHASMYLATDPADAGTFSSGSMRSPVDWGVL